jgi:hypothetical protein
MTVRLENELCPVIFPPGVRSGTRNHDINHIIVTHRKRACTKASICLPKISALIYYLPSTSHLLFAIAFPARYIRLELNSASAMSNPVPDPAEVAQWSSQQLLQYVTLHLSRFSVQNLKTFGEKELDGSQFLELSSMEFFSSFPLPLGPSLRLMELVQKIKGLKSGFLRVCTPGRSG